MIDIQDPAGTRMRGAIGGYATVAAGARSFTQTVRPPSSGVPMITAASWSCGHPYLTDYQETTFTITFPIPAPPGGGQVRWMLFF
jgi:hypothetical protein